MKELFFLPACLWARYGYRIIGLWEGLNAFWKNVARLQLTLCRQ